MKYILFVSLLLTSVLVYSQKSSKELYEIKEVLNSQIDSWNEGNIEDYMEGYWNSDSLLFIGSRGPKYGWLTTLANYKKSYPNKDAMGDLGFGIIKIELISKESAYVIGKWKLKRSEDEPNGYFTLIWKKINGEWKIIADHSSSAKD